MSPKNDAIDALIDELETLAKSRDDAWQVPREEGELLRQIALAQDPKVIVEIGTSYGFSGLFWASALAHTGGRLHTIDMDPTKYNSSRETFKRAGVDHLIVSHLGDALPILQAFDSPIDIAFIDADKQLCHKFFDVLWPKIKKGGSVLTDNIRTHREELSDYVKYVRSQPNTISSEIGIGNGVEWTIKV